MSKGPVEEFTLDGAGTPGEESSAGHSVRGHGPPGPDRRRRSTRGWWRSPGPWVAAAVVLVVVGAAVSPQGEPLEPRPPDTAWAAPAEPGRAPGVWVLGDQPVVTTADGVTAFDPSTGDSAWTVPLADPACTATDQALTCVHGEGENAAIATINPTGEATELPFPDADIATQVGEDLIIGGGLTSNPWLGRYTTGEGPPTEVWRYQPEYPVDGPERWTDATLSQGIATISADSGETVVDGSGQFDSRAALAADLETGEPRPAVVRTTRASGVSYTVGVEDEWNHVVLPLPGPEPTVPGYPDAVFTGRGAFDEYRGDRILEYLGSPLLAVDGTIIIAELDTDLLGTLEPGEEVELVTQTERVDVRTGEAQWQLNRDQLMSCPCAAGPDTMVLTGSEITDVDRFTVGPVALLGIHPDTGRHEWTLPISTAPDAVAAGADQVYVLTAGTLTAYENT